MMPEGGHKCFPAAADLAVCMGPSQPGRKVSGSVSMLLRRISASSGLGTTGRG